MRNSRPLVFALYLFLSFCTAHASATDFTGLWQGKLEVGSASMRLRFSFEQDAAAGLTGTMISVDQGAQSIPCEVAIAGDSIQVEVPSIRGSYSGLFVPADQQVKGEWSQGGKIFPLILARFSEEDEDPVVRLDDQPYGHELPGIWLGSLKQGPMELRLQLNVDQNEGELSVTFVSVDQGGTRIPARLELHPDRRISAEVVSIGGRYEADLTATGDTLSGIWFQGGQELDLVLVRTVTGAILNRPQEPEPPFPYEVHEVLVEDGVPGVALAGSLTVPRGQGPFPAVVLVSGSGPQNRNEELMGHKPFLILADALTRRGIAVLRYDDRGTALSTGDFSTATTADFAADARAAVEFLLERPEVDSAAVGIVGHSEGGLVAPMVAAGMDGLGFIVMLAGPGVPGGEILKLQTRLMAAAAGGTEDVIAARLGLLENYLEILAEEPDNDAAREKIFAAARAESDRLGWEGTDAELRAEAAQMSTPWIRWFLGHDPATYLEQVTCPVLAVNGSLDLQVDAEQNLPTIRAALERGGNTRVETHELKGLNHLFQSATTGAPSEYGKIEETMSPVLLELVGDWILECVN